MLQLKGSPKFPVPAHSNSDGFFVVVVGLVVVVVGFLPLVVDFLVGVVLSLVVGFLVGVVRLVVVGFFVVVVVVVVIDVVSDVDAIVGRSQVPVTQPEESKVSSSLQL